VALLPLVIIWLGIGILSKVGIIFLGAVFPILINARDGVKDHAAESAHRRQEFRRFRCMIFKTVVFPRPFRLSLLD
jgi:NitT/TauT family transport system permease protein